MAVAFDAFSSQLNPNPSFTHTPVGTPRAALVMVSALGGTDTVSTPTYGGVTMTEVTGSPLLKSATEALACHAFFLGASIPTGAQTVSFGTAPAGNEIAVCYTLTADTDTEVVAINTSINSDAVADPSSTLGLLGRTSFVAMVFASGQNLTTGTTPLSGWNSRAEASTGAQVGGSYSYDTIGSTDVTVGWTQTTEDALAIGVAISEVAAGSASTHHLHLHLLGVG